MNPIDYQRSLETLWAKVEEARKQADKSLAERDEARKLAENYRDGWAKNTCPSLAPSHIARLPWEENPDYDKP